jgi:rhomboid protease GluP
MIEDRLSSGFINNGYQRMDSNAQGIYLFYRVEENGIMLISVIRATSGKELTLEQYQHVLNQIKTSFGQSYPEKLKLLSLILTENADEVKPLAINSSVDSHWIVDMRNYRLIIYETQSNKFASIQNMIEQVLTEESSKDSSYTSYPGNNTGQYYKQQSAPYSSQNRFKQMPATMVLIAINVLVYLLTHFTIFLSGPDSVVEKGALSWYLIKENQEYYRIITSMFLHADWSHLFNNMLVLLFVGGNLERAIGKIKYLILYFGTGILAGIASISYNMWKEYALATIGNTTYSIGASGAIFGVVGAVLWIVVINKGKLKEISSTQMILFVILSLYGGVVNSQIDQAAHVGGFLGGVILSMLLYRKQRKKSD